MRETEIAAVRARGVRIVAQIHHSHGVKAALAYGRLRERFAHWPSERWHEVLTRARWHEELTVEAPATAPLWQVSPQRARSVIARAVVPACYSAMRAWARAEGGEAIARAYLDTACADLDDLGHRVSILLAFIESWPHYRGTPDEDLWVDRLCEFLLACQFGAAARAALPSSEITFDDALGAALQRPGFFGHHVITLAWVRRHRDTLTEAQRSACLHEVLRTSAAAAETSPAAVHRGEVPDEQALEAGVHRLLSEGTPNLHLLTLADAVVSLWGEARPDHRSALLGLMRSVG